jgi:hypothetical protein
MTDEPGEIRTPASHQGHAPRAVIDRRYQRAQRGNSQVAIDWLAAS